MSVPKTLPGFRDHFPDEIFVRNYLFEAWRRVAGHYGFVEYEGALLEPTELYRKKSGDEILSQLFHFTDPGGREVALRPEVTPSLARMLATRPKDFRKPLKWFQMGSCFRAEKPQKGRRREFIQFNLDILGEPGPSADAELIALSIDLMRDLGFTEKEFVVRLSSRQAWDGFLRGRGFDDAGVGTALSAIDRMEKDPQGAEKALAPLGLTLDEIRAFIDDPAHAREALAPVTDELAARGLERFIRPDLTVVRGLAYYTGTVFEIFDASGSMRAIAGGGRYDSLLSLVSDGKLDLPAAGFAMGDVVIANLIAESGEPRMRMEAWRARQSAADVYVIIAAPERRKDALATVQQLRDAGLSVDFPLGSAKFGKQFQAAEAAGARVGVIIGNEFPDLAVKHLATRREVPATPGTLLATVRDLLDAPGPLIA